MSRMEIAEESGVSTRSNAPRKRNLFFLTKSAKTPMYNVASRSDIEDSDSSEKTGLIDVSGKQNIVSGSTINIDINEKIEIRLGKLPTNSATVDKEMKNENKRKLPDLKPISSTSKIIMCANNPNRKVVRASDSQLHTTRPVFDNILINHNQTTKAASEKAVSGTGSTQNLSSGVKKSKWKCKKCDFQHVSKEEVISHVRLVHKRAAALESKDLPNVKVPSTMDITNSNSQAENSTTINGNDEQKPKEDNLEDCDSTPKSTPRGFGAKVYGCGECPYTTGCKSQFVNHARFHRPNNGNFKCKHCTYNVTHKHLLLQHVRVHGVYDITSEIQTDSRAENGSNAIFAMNGTSKLLNHNYRHSKRVNGVTKRFSNSIETLISNKRMSDGQKFMSFSSRAIVKTMLYLCKECPARFFQEKQLKTHCSFHWANFKIKCYMCSYSTIQKEHLISHMKVHSKIYQFKTSKLLSLYPQAKSSLQTKSKTNGNPPQPLGKDNNNITMSPNNSLVYCEKCPSKFFSGILYRQHSVYHGKLSNYQCRLCNFGTDTSIELAIHKLIHAGSDVEIKRGNHWMKFGVTVKNTSPQTTPPGNRAKYYKCNKCPFEFSKRDRYELHLKQHGSNQKYTCTVCDFSVNLYVNYVQHLKKHGSAFINNEDPTEMYGCDPENGSSTQQNFSHLHKCDICPFYAVDEETVTQHMLQHDTSLTSKLQTSAEDSYETGIGVNRTCSLCGYMTSDTNLFKEHEESHLKSNENSVSNVNSITEKSTNDDNLDFSEYGELNIIDDSCKTSLGITKLIK